MDTPKTRIATVVLALRENDILLGRKRGAPEIGEGTLNGPGGKLEPPDASIRHGAAREAFEEVGIVIDPADLELAAVITFYAAGVPNMEVHFFFARTFSGEPRETVSMVPEWHALDAIPYDRMLEADLHFFPQLIRGEKFRTNVYYAKKAQGYLGIDPFLPLDE